MGFWAAVELLVAAHDASSQAKPFEDETEDWLGNVSSKVLMQLRDNHHQLVERRKRRNVKDSIDYGNLVDCSLTYLPVKNRLEKLMGSCVVRLTDRKYMTKLMAKIREDYVASQEARIRDRKWQELMRTKNMILNRFISIEEADAEILEYPLFQLYKYCDSLERRVKKPSPKKVRISTSLYDLLYPSKPDGAEEEGEGEDDAPMKEVVVDGERQMVPLSPEELREYREKQELQRDIDNGYMYSQEDFESLHYEAETIKKLKATKTVDDMYTRAHEIVGVLYSFGPNEKHKRCELDDAASVMTADSRANADFAADQKSEEDPEEEEQESGNEEPAPERQPVQQSEDGPPSP